MSLFRKAPLGVLVAAMLAAPAANAVNLSTDGVGDLAIAPYYTVNNGWDTLINLTNTRPYPVVVKVRFHEYRNSRDVFDFLVAMSAYDNWTAQVTENAAGKVKVNIVDEDTCTVPKREVLMATTLSDIGYLGYSGNDARGTANEDGGPTGPGADDQESENRLREGYIEFIVMGHTGVGSDIMLPYDIAQNGDVSPYSGNYEYTGDLDTSMVDLPEIPFPAMPSVIGAQIQQHDCDAVDNAFKKSNIVETASQFGEPINALKFNFRFINVEMGTEAGGNATTWANFWNGNAAPPVFQGLDAPVVVPGAPVAQDFNVLTGYNGACTIDRGNPRNNNQNLWNPYDAAGLLSCLNLITAQEQYDFLDPSVNDAFPVVGYFIDDATAGLMAIDPSQAGDYASNGNVGFRGVDALSATIQRSAVINEWAAPNNGVSTTGAISEWVVTFPTKYFYVDQGLGRQFAIIDTWEYGDRMDAEHATGDGTGGGDYRVLVPYPPFAQAFAAPGRSCNEVAFARFDRMQNLDVTSGGTIPSPAPPTARSSLCYEANVVTFDDADPVFGAENPANVGITVNGGPVDQATAGWMKLRLDTEASANAAQTAEISYLFNNGADVVEMDADRDGGLLGWSGLPAIGFMLKQRDFGDASLNYSSSVEHGFERSCDDLNDNGGANDPQCAPAFVPFVP